MNRLLARFEFPTHRLVPGAGLVALYAAGLAGAPIPVWLRIGIAVTALSIWPGAMLLRFLLAGKEVEWPERVAYAFALGLLLAQVAILGAHFAHLDPVFVLWALPAGGLVLACVRRVPAVEEPEARGALPWMLLAGWSLVLALAFGALGAPLMSDTDSPDHIATVRRIMVTHEAFPNDAFFADAGRFGADPRKGLYHPWVALVARASGTSALEVWRTLPLFLVPLLSLAIYALTVALTASRTASLIAALLLPLLYGGGPGGTELRETVYSTRVGELIALLAAAAFVRFVERGGRRRLALFWATAACAVFVHLWYVIYFAIALGAYAAATALVRRDRQEVARMALGLAGIVVMLAPYLVFRAGQAYSPQNEIHTEPQGLLYLDAQRFVVDPRVVFAWHGIWLLITLLAAPWFWSRRRVSTGAIYCAVVPWAVVLVVLNPLVLPFVQAKLGYLTMRFVWVIPVIPAIATLASAWGEAVLRAEGRARLRGALALAGCGILLLPAVHQGWTVLTERGALRAAEAERGPARWGDLLAELERWPGPLVFLSDPATNYSIPAYTGHHVSAYLDQHSSPNDPKGLERILDARDVLSPYVDMAKTIAILREYGVDYVVLNSRSERPMSFDYWTLQPALYQAMHDKFAQRPELFTLAWSAPRIEVYALTPRAKSGPLPLAVPPSRPFVLDAAHAPQTAPLRDGDFLQYGTTVVPSVASPGDTLDIATAWAIAGETPLPPGSYQVFVRLEAPPPRGFLYAEAYDKLHRKLEERFTGQRWRMRETHLPLGGVLGPDQWRPGEIVEDRSRFAIAREAAPGTYVVRVRLVRTPHYVNLGVRDYLRDDDRFNGPVVGQVTIVPRVAAGVRP